MSSLNICLSPLAEEVLAHLHVATIEPIHHAGQRVARGDWVKIAPGSYLDSVMFENKQTWECANLVSLARILTACASQRRIAHRFSALALMGIPTLNVPASVDVIVPCRSGGKITRFPAVIWNNQKILGPGILRQHLAKSDMPLWTLKSVNNSVEKQLPFTPRTTTLSYALMDIACMLPGEEAFVALCMGLHRATGKKHVRGTNDRHVLEESKMFLLSMVDRLPAGARGKTLARLLIQNADGGADSVGEARLQWILKCAGLKGLETQTSVPGWEETFFIDIAQPECKLAIEFDGLSKYAVNDGMQLKYQLCEQSRRQTFIESQDYVMVRFQWLLLEQPTKIIDQIEWRLHQVNREMPIVQNSFTRRFGPDVFG